MGIKRKVWALPAIATAIFSLGLAVSVYFVNDALSSIQKTEQADYPALDTLKTLRLDVQGVADALKDAVSEGDKNRIEQIGELASKVRANMQQLSAIPGQRDVGARLQQEFDAYYAPALSAARIMLEMEQGNPQEVVSRMQAAQKVLEQDLAKANDAAQDQFKNGIASSLDNVRNSLVTNVLVAVVVILSLAVVSTFVVRAIWQQLGGEPEYAREIASAIAQGNLSIDIVVDGDNHRSILGELLGMKQRLESMVSGIKTSTETIKLASGEIAQGNADLSARTESQASSLEQTTASVSTLTDTVKQNADNARTANQLVQTASGIAVRGGQVVNEVVTTMGEIHGSANKIVEIISVIDGIAFQTNILALNAAVEAARAGEQGRGFAVVASEVRNLAQRSAAAAKEIKALIGDSVEKVNVGSRLVDEAGKTMDEIVKSVKRVTDIMAEIAGASQEQSTGIQEISSAIGHIDDMTQQNSALVEQAAAAAAALQEQANHLSTAVSVFRLSAQGGEGNRPEMARVSGARDLPPRHLALIRDVSAAPSLRS